MKRSRGRRSRKSGGVAPLAFIGAALSAYGLFVAVKNAAAQPTPANGARVAEAAVSTLMRF